MSDFLDSCFPNLRATGYQLTSPPTKQYNCIAWAAGQTDVWWWPDPNYIGYWPDGVPRELTLSAFVEAFKTLAYAPCDNASWQSH